MRQESVPLGVPIIATLERHLVQEVKLAHTVNHKCVKWMSFLGIEYESTSDFVKVIEELL